MRCPIHNGLYGPIPRGGDRPKNISEQPGHGVPDQLEEIAHRRVSTDSEAIDSCFGFTVDIRLTKRYLCDVPHIWPGEDLQS
jgi:hypothetical protein